MKEDNAYILGTDTEELHRLGVQHQVWASEAQKGWELAGFKAGDHLLDLGCGPGFCTKEMAFISGASGSVIGVDRSMAFIQHLQQTAALHRLPIEGICQDFSDLNLEPASLDGIYCRWALAWVSNPKAVLKTAYDALKPSGRMVLHEYYDWSTHQTEPKLVGLEKAIKAALRSFKEQEGEIDVGRHLPKMCTNLGMKVSSTRLMTKLAQPGTLNWEWPKTFYHSYFPRLQEAGYLTSEEVIQAINDMDLLESNPNSSLFCPMMIEVIAEKF